MKTHAESTVRERRCARAGCASDNNFRAARANYTHVCVCGLPPRRHLRAPLQRASFLVFYDALSVCVCVGGVVFFGSRVPVISELRVCVEVGRL